MLGEVDSPLTVLVSTWLLLGVSTIVVGLRVYARISRVRLVRADDYLMLTALAIEYVSMVLITISHHHGVGLHFDTLKATVQKWILRLIIGGVQLSCILPSMFGRLSFATLLLYIIGPDQTTKKFILWATIAFQIAIHVVVIVQLYAQCGTHISALWNPEARVRAHCQSPLVQSIIGYVQGALNSLCDITLSILPAFILWKLKIKKQQKFGLAAVLMLSIFAFVASIIKLLQTRLIAKTNDVTWYSVTLQFWVTVENNVVIITGSIPAVVPLFRQRKPGSTQTQTQTQTQMQDSRLSRRSLADPRKPADASFRRWSRIDSVSSGQTDCILANLEKMGILKTTTIEVTIEKSRRRDSIDEERMLYAPVV